MKKLRYFEESEFARCTPACKSSDICQDSLERLDECRALAGVPFVLNSCYRSYDYERKQGRSGKSAHCLGRAFDIKCTDSSARYRIIAAALQCGFSRIGVYKRFIHLDDAISLPTHVIWYG